MYENIYMGVKLRLIRDGATKIWYISNRFYCFFRARGQSAECRCYNPVVSMFFFLSFNNLARFHYYIGANAVRIAFEIT